MKKYFSMFFGFAILFGLGCIIYLIFSKIITWISSLDSDLAGAVLTACSTILVAAFTLVLGRYFEKSKETLTHFREKKVEIYDDFLKEFFSILHSSGSNDGSNNEELIDFLREWQRKLIVWGGANVLLAYIKWVDDLKKGNPTAETMFLMGDFFMAIRKDIGLSNFGIERNLFCRLILKDAEKLINSAKKNPNIPLSSALD